MPAGEFPSEGMELTHILVVSDIEHSRHFYTDILGATLYREYGGTSIVYNFQGAWLLIVTPGGPTEDKPDVEFVAPNNPRKVRHSFTIRVPDCQAVNGQIAARTATAPKMSSAATVSDLRPTAGLECSSGLILVMSVSPKRE